MATTGPQLFQAFNRLLESQDKKMEKNMNMLLTLSLAKSREKHEIGLQQARLDAAAELQEAEAISAERNTSIKVLLGEYEKSYESLEQTRSLFEPYGISPEWATETGFQLKGSLVEDGTVNLENLAGQITQIRDRQKELGTKISFLRQQEEVLNRMGPDMWGLNEMLQEMEMFGKGQLVDTATEHLSGREKEMAIKGLTHFYRKNVGKPHEIAAAVNVRTEQMLAPIRAQMQASYGLLQGTVLTTTGSGSSMKTTAKSDKQLKEIFTYTKDGKTIKPPKEMIQQIKVMLAQSNPEDFLANLYAYQLQPEGKHLMEAFQSVPEFATNFANMERYHKKMGLIEEEGLGLIHETGMDRFQSMLTGVTDPQELLDIYQSFVSDKPVEEHSQYWDALVKSAMMLTPGGGGLSASELYNLLMERMQSPDTPDTTTDAPGSRQVKEFTNPDGSISKEMYNPNTGTWEPYEFGLSWYHYGAGDEERIVWDNEMSAYRLPTLDDDGAPVDKFRPYGGGAEWMTKDEYEYWRSTGQSPTEISVEEFKDKYIREPVHEVFVDTPVDIFNQTKNLVSTPSVSEREDIYGVSEREDIYEVSPDTDAQGTSLFGKWMDYERSQWDKEVQEIQTFAENPLKYIREEALSVLDTELSKPPWMWHERIQRGTPEWDEEYGRPGAMEEAIYTFLPHAREVRE